MVEDEKYLVEKAQLGNKSAMNILLTNNYPILKGYLIKMTLNPYETEDIIQETMLKAIINIEKFKPKAKFSTWLIKIATNIYMDMLRKHKKIVFIDTEISSIINLTEDEALLKIEYENVKKALLSLSLEKRTVFILKHYYNYKYDEISEILDCPIGTVRSRLHNAIKEIITIVEGGSSIER